MFTTATETLVSVTITPRFTNTPLDGLALPAIRLKAHKLTPFNHLRKDFFQAIQQPKYLEEMKEVKVNVSSVPGLQYFILFKLIAQNDLALSDSIEISPELWKKVDERFLTWVHSHISTYNPEQSFHNRCAFVEESVIRDNELLGEPSHGQPHILLELLLLDVSLPLPQKCPATEKPWPVFCIQRNEAQDVSRQNIDAETKNHDYTNAHFRLEAPNLIPSWSLLPRICQPDLPTSLAQLKSLVVVGANGAGKSRFGRSLAYHNTKHNEVGYVLTKLPLEFGTYISARRTHSSKDRLEPDIEDSWAMPLRVSDFVPRDSSFPTNRIIPSSFHPETPHNSLDRLLVQVPATTPGFDEAVKGVINVCLSASILLSPKLAPFTWTVFKSAWEAIYPRLELHITALDDIKQTQFVRSMLLSQGTGHSTACLFVSRHDQDHAPKYPVSFLSDGEQDVFTLIWRVLHAPSLAVIVVDEPEAHLHRSAMEDLWNYLQNLKPACVFVYITHDLSFAVSRPDSTVVSIIEHEPHQHNPSASQWNWLLQHPMHDLDPVLVLRVLGGRGKTFIFVEGHQSGWDYKIYHAIFGKRAQVLAVGGCSSVMSAIEFFTSHSNEVYGIVDLDANDENQFNNPVHPLRKVSEVETFLCTFEVFKTVADHLQLTNIDSCWNNASTVIKQCFVDNLDNSVNQRLESLNMTKECKQQRQQELKIEFEKYVTDECVSDMLRWMNCKKENKKPLVTDVAKQLGLSMHLYVNKFIHLLSQDKTLKSISQYIPNIPFQ